MSARTVTVVGASMAGLNAARALRLQGFDGRVVLVGAERYRPYDRPPLSKDFLAGRMDAADLSLEAPGDDDLDLDWRLGVAATGLEPGTGGRHVVGLASGERVTSDGVVIATGARVRELPAARGPSGPAEGVFTLRTLDDAVALKAALRPGIRLLIVGGGFIGAEIASTATGIGIRDVTVVEALQLPLAGPLGPQYAAVCAGWHAANGVRLLTGVGVAAMLGGDRVTHVRLADGRDLAADVVVVGIGTVPNTEWLAGSGIPAGPGGVRTDARGATGVPGVVATGDVAAAPDPFSGQLVRNEHWTEALTHPEVAVATLLGGPVPARRATADVPYFWSDQYGLRLQFAGHAMPGDRTELVDGDVAANSFVAVYRRDSRPVAVLGVDRPKVFNRWRRELAATLRADRVSGP